MQTGKFSRNSARARRSGFTLIELMIVMAIVVILIATAIPQYQKSLIRAKEKRSQEQPLYYSDDD